MAIDFPNTPSVNQLFSVGDRTWQWNGTAWVAASSAAYATLTGVQTLTNKTLTAPKFVNAGFIADSNGNELLEFGVTASAVNEIKIINAATGNSPTITTEGGDTNVGLLVTTKGTGGIVLDTGTGAGNLELKPGSGNLRVYDDDSSNYYSFVTGNTASNYTITLPAANISFGGAFTTANSFTTSGNNALTLTTTGATNVTLPTSGTLVNTAVTSLSSLATVGTITSGTWNATEIGTVYGGTGITSYTTGDILYASATNTLSKLGVGNSGDVLTISGGVPAWAAPSGGSSTITVTTPTFTTNVYTLVLGDAGELLLASNGTTAGTIRVDVDANVNFPVGTQIHIVQTNTGQITIAATTPATTTILSPGATTAQPKLRTRYSSATLIKTAANTWYVMGDIV